LAGGSLADAVVVVFDMKFWAAGAGGFGGA
jgi:hypothetical protein